MEQYESGSCQIGSEVFTAKQIAIESGVYNERQYGFAIELGRWISLEVTKFYDVETKPAWNCGDKIPCLFLFDENTALAFDGILIHWEVNHPNKGTRAKFKYKFTSGDVKIMKRDVALKLLKEMN